MNDVLEPLKNSIYELDDMGQQIELIVGYLDLLNCSVESKNKNEQATALYASLIHSGGLRNNIKNLELINKKVSTISDFMMDIHDDIEM